MRDLTSDNGRYYAVQQDDHNFVVYELPSWKPVWDQWSHEASHGHPDPPPTPDPPTPGPTPGPVPKFDFKVIPITDDTQGYIPRREYSYWAHACVIGDTTYVLTCASDGHPKFFRVDAAGNVTSMGPMVGYTGEGEGWYFDRQGRLYIIQGPQLHRVNPFNGQDEVVFDISDKYGNHNLWQAHSSDDGNTHCATVRENSNDFNPHVATVIAQGNRKTYVPAMGKQDESHITADGGFCIIEEDDNNRIVSVKTGAEQLILDGDGALSHIDCGPGYMVGEDNIHGVAWKIDLPSLQRTPLEQTWGMGHVSVQNNRCLLSNQSSLMWMDLNGNGLTHVLDHGMVGSGYDYQVKANLDPTGSVAVYMTNQGGSPNQAVMLVRLPPPPRLMAVRKPKQFTAMRSYHRQRP